MPGPAVQRRARPAAARAARFAVLAAVGMVAVEGVLPPVLLRQRGCAPPVVSRSARLQRTAPGAAAKRAWLQAAMVAPMLPVATRAACWSVSLLLARRVAATLQVSSAAPAERIQRAQPRSRPWRPQRPPSVRTTAGYFAPWMRTAPRCRGPLASRAATAGSSLVACPRAHPPAVLRISCVASRKAVVAARCPLA